MLTFVGRTQADIAMLQETHLSHVEHLSLEQGSFKQELFSLFISNSRGVAILVSRGLTFVMLDCIKDNRGRYIIV